MDSPLYNMTLTELRMYKAIGGILPTVLERRLQRGEPDRVAWYQPARLALPPLVTRPLEDVRAELAGLERHAMAAKLGQAAVERPVPQILRPIESIDPWGLRYATLLTGARRLRVDVEELLEACRDGSTRCYGRRWRFLRSAA